MSFMRRFSGLAAALLVCGAGSLAGQYFGKNKVQYGKFDFQIIRTEHFEVYFYERERAAALDAARMAERGYARLSRILHHQFQARKPIILYASASDFQQTNIIDATGEGLGGVTEFFKHRMVLPFTGSYAELEHVIGHEMRCLKNSVDRKSTRLNSSHLVISYAVFCLKQTKTIHDALIDDPVAH